MSVKPNLAHLINIFLSCADEDKEFLHGLERHLSSLRREGYIECWHRHKVSPGSEWQDLAKKHLISADIILLLISPHFIASDYCYNQEAFHAMTQSEKRSWDHIIIA